MNIRPFEIVLIAIFAGSALAGLMYLSIFKGGGSAKDEVYGQRVQMWGTFDSSKMDTLLSEVSTTDAGFKVVKYRQIDERSFEGELVNAIADGNPPDVVLIPHTMLVMFRSKLLAIPKETLDERTFRSTYIDGAEIFMRSSGTYALPLGVDPLVLFWNRDHFASAGLATPPKTWEMLVSESTPRLTVVDSKRAITQSAIGMGEFINVHHAKEILSLLLFQAGTSIVTEENDRYTITLTQREDGGTPPAQSALNFYTQFASPVSSAFTWSRTQQLDKNAFTAGKLSMYLGFGSEIQSIEEQNPNLNFDITAVPQAQGATALRNYGTFYGFAIPKTSANIAGAYQVVAKLTEAGLAKKFTDSLAITPVARSLYTGGSTGMYESILRQSALISRGWLDPSPKDSSNAFKTMIEGITFGRSDADRLVNDASYTLETLFR